LSLFVCLFVFVCLLATLRKNFQTNLHEIFTQGWQWAIEQIVKFWWRSGSRIRIRIRIRNQIRIWIRIATLVKCALAEVYTVPVHQTYAEDFSIDSLLLKSYLWVLGNGYVSHY